jgi:uncharacterized OB-fold protein
MLVVLFREPTPSFVGREYWERCARGELAAQRCDSCGLLRRYLTRVCPRCKSTDYTWEALSGAGTVYASTVNHFALSPEFEAPYVVALVDLDEGLRVMTNIVECDPESVAPGIRVTVVWDRVSDVITLPLFKPAAERDGEAA